MDQHRPLGGRSRRHRTGTRTVPPVEQAATTPSPTPRPRLVGRDGELLDLLAHLDRTEVSPTGPLLLAGEPGIGKSRILAELAHRAGRRGWMVVWGRAWDEIDAPPFWIWTQVARDLRGATSGTQLADVVLDEPELTERFELFDATAELVRRAGADRPLLVLLDDLHAADQPSLLLTRFVAEQVGAHPVALVGSYRPVDAAHRPEVLAHIEALVQAGTELRVEALGPEALNRLIADPDLAREVHALTGGNPLFVEQVLRLATAGRSRPAGADALPTTDALRLAISTRIATLEPAHRHALVAASVLGRPTTAGELATLLDTDTTYIEGIVDELVAVGLIARSTDHVTTFHQMVAEAALDGADPDEVAVLHQRASTMMGHDHERLGERAHHLLRAGPDHQAEAVDACLGAAAAAASIATEEAIQHYHRALSALDGANNIADPDRTRLSILLDLGRSQRRSDHVAAADQTFEKAYALADALDDADGRALAALRGGIQYFFRRDLDQIPAARSRSALDALPDGDSTLRARLLADLSARISDPDQLDESRRLADEAVAIARRLDDPVALGYALIAQQATNLGPRTLPRRLSTARELLVLARRAEDPTLSVQGRFLLLNALIEQGDIKGLEAGLTASPPASGHLADRNHARFGLWLACTRALLAGDAERAEALAEQYLAHAIEHGEPYGPRVFGGQLGAIRWLQGRSAELEQVYEEQHRANPGEAVWPAALANICAADGRDDEARTLLARMGDLQVVPDGLHWLVTMTLAGEAAAQVGDDDTAAAFWEQLLPYADRFVPINLGAAVWGTVARPLGLLSQRLGRDEEAISHFERAVRVSARLGARPWLIEAQLELAEAMISAEQQDRARIDELVAEAISGAHELGIERFVARAERLADQRSSPPTRPAPTSTSTRPSISVLGNFEVTSTGGEVARWSSRKARDLVKILVARRGTAVHREVLMDLLWPGIEPASLRNRLSVALSTVRRALDPERSHPADEFIATDADAVWLRLDRIDVDAEQFLHLSRRALDAHTAHDPSAPELLAAAASTHLGPALADEPYADWASALQSEVQLAYLRVLRAQADQALAAGDDLTAADAFRRLAEADPLDETAHTGLIRALERIGAPGLASTERHRFHEATGDALPGPG